MNEELLKNLREQNTLKQKLRGKLSDEERQRCVRELADLETRHVDLLARQDVRKVPAPLAEIVNLRSYARKAAAKANRHLEGPEKELNEELGLPIHETENGMAVPWSALLNRHELQEIRKRADASVTVDATNDPQAISARNILERVFKESEMAFLGVDSSIQESGSVRFPIFSNNAGAAGTTTGTAGTAVDTEATTITASAELSPERTTAGYQTTLEALSLLGDSNLSEALSSDLRMAIMSKIDDGVMAKVMAITSLFGANATSEVTAENFLASVAGNIDAHTFGYSLQGIKLMFLPTTLQLLLGKFRSNAEGNAIDLVEKRGVMCKSSSRITADDGTDKQSHVLSIGPMGMTSNSLQFVSWKSFFLTRDPYTNLTAGQIRLVASVLWNFSIVRDLALKGFKIKNAA